MLHIILAILKLIGIILAIILLLLLILVLIVFFVPVRYRIEGARKEGELPTGAGSVTWLGRMLAVSGEFRDGKPSVGVRILFWKKQLMGGENDSGGRKEELKRCETPDKKQSTGISLKKEGSKEIEKKKKSIQKDNERVEYKETEIVKDSEGTEYKESETIKDSEETGYEETKIIKDSEETGYREIKILKDSEGTGYKETEIIKDSEETGYKKTEIIKDSEGTGYKETKIIKDSEETGYKETKIIKNSEGIDDKKAAIITETKHAKEAREAEEKTAEKETKSSPQKHSPIKKLMDRLKALWQWLKGIPDRIRKILKSLTVGKEKAQEYLDILRSDPVKHVLGRFKGHLRYLFKHLGPRRIKGQLRYGFEDPAATGQLTGILYLLFTRKKFQMELQPDFDDQVLEGTLMIKGHIRFCHVVWVGIRVLLDKEFRGLLRKFLKKR